MRKLPCQTVSKIWRPPGYEARTTITGSPTEVKSFLADAYLWSYYGQIGSSVRAVCGWSCRVKCHGSTCGLKSHLVLPHTTLCGFPSSSSVV